LSNLLSLVYKCKYLASRFIFNLGLLLLQHFDILIFLLFQLVFKSGCFILVALENLLCSYCLGKLFVELDTFIFGMHFINQIGRTHSWILFSLLARPINMLSLVLFLALVYFYRDHSFFRSWCFNTWGLILRSLSVLNILNVFIIFIVSVCKSSLRNRKDNVSLGFKWILK